MDKNNLKVEYENNPSKNYIVIYAESIDCIVDYEVEMINNNPTSGALNIEIRQFNDKIKVLYDVTGKRPIKEYLKERTIRKSEFITILKNMVICLLECKNYFLDEKKFFINLGTIFINEKDLSVNLLYLPFQMDSEENINITYRNIVKSLIIDFVNIEEKASENIIKETLNYLRKDDFTLIGFKNYLQSVEENKINAAPYVENRTAGFTKNSKLNKQDSSMVNKDFNEMPIDDSTNSVNSNVSKVKAYDVVTEKNAESSNNKIEQKNNTRNIKHPKVLYIIIIQLIVAAIMGVEAVVIEDLVIMILAILGVFTIDVVLTIFILLKNRNKGETAADKRRAKTSFIHKDKGVKKSTPSKREIVTEMSFETELLDTKTAFLMSKKAGTVERIFINKDCFKIGRISGVADYISDNKAVGKLHAEIREQNDKYYVVDLNSKNGTFINGQRINSNELYQIRNGDTIVFANSEFTFAIQ